MFDHLASTLIRTVERLEGRPLDDKQVAATCRQVRMALLEADVNFTVARRFVADLEGTLSSIDPADGPVSQQVLDAVHTQLVGLLGGDGVELTLPEPGSRVATPLVLVGLQGAGKTATTGKLARWLTARGYTVVAAAADTVRPAAAQQLGVAARKVGFDVVDHRATGVEDPTAADPVAIVAKAREVAVAQGADVLLVDTAGRLHVDSELLAQARAIKQVAGEDPLTLFVLDAMGGQESVNVAAGFRDQVGFDGVVLTKTDGDTRGGAALSVRHVTGVPIVFSGIGELPDDLEAFHPDRAADRILDRGDLRTLAERTVGTGDAARLARGEVDLDTFLVQLRRLRAGGEVSRTLRLLPGARDHLDAIGNIDDEDLAELERTIAVMPPELRRTPSRLRGDAALRAQVAADAEVDVEVVDRLLARLDDVTTAIRQVIAHAGDRQIDGVSPELRRQVSRASTGSRERQVRRDKAKKARKAKKRRR